MDIPLGRTTTLELGLAGRASLGPEAPALALGGVILGPEAGAAVNKTSVKVIFM